MNPFFTTTIVLIQMSVPVLANGEDPPQSIVLAHGVLAGVLFAIFFPLGAIILRTRHSPNVVRFHGAWQTVCYVSALAALGMGAWLATTTDQWTASNGHPIIGTIVISLLLFQPFGGLIHHRMYQQRAPDKVGTTPVGLAHRWGGRILLLVGAINGGLGAQLASEDSKFIIPYSVVVAVVYLTWLVVVILQNRRSSGKGAPR